MHISKLVVGWDTYTWVYDLAGLILKTPKLFEVLIVLKDDESQIIGCRDLCNEAIYAQRSYDLFQIGQKLGLSKLSNCLYTPNNLDVLSLTAKLQMKVLLSGVTEIYFQYNKVLETIFSSIQKKIGIQVYAFNKNNGDQKVIPLTDVEKRLKKDILASMIGIPHYQSGHLDKEYIYLLEEVKESL